MPPTSDAVEALVELGLSEHQARCFVAFTQLSEGTAEEAAKVADLPAARVHEAAEWLHRRGLVEVQASEPRRYRAIPVDDALDRLEREYADTLEIARDRLLGLDSRDGGGEGVWAVADEEGVDARCLGSVGTATEEVYLLVADEAILERDLLAALADAAADGVAVHAEVPTVSASERVRDAVPAASVAVSSLPLASPSTDRCRPGRLLLVDREAVLLSALREDYPSRETGLWASGSGHGLVSWLGPLLGARLEQLRAASD